jgi:hypothetical protein
MYEGQKPISHAGSLVAKLRPSLAFFPLDDDWVVFSEESQSLVALNATAGFLVRKLQEGAPSLTDSLVAEMGVAPRDAQGWVSATLDALSSQGLLDDGRIPVPLPMDNAESDEEIARRTADMPALAPYTPCVEGRYRLLGTCVLIRYAHGAQMRMVDTVIGHLKADENTAPTLAIDITGVPTREGQIVSDIYCNGKPEAQAGRLSKLGPLVKAALWREAVNSSDFLLDLHAGVVGRNGRCILLPAAAGSGKSSLTAALVHAGYDYFSDEVALVEPGTFRVRPVPLATCVKSTAWDLMSRYYPELPTFPIHRRDDGKVVRYVPPHPARIQKTPALVSHIFFPRYVEGQATQLKPLARSDALARLMDQCLALRLRLDQGSVGELIRWIAGIDCYALTFSSLDEAVARINGALTS